MNQHRPNGAVVDGTRLNNVAHDSKSDTGLRTADEGKEAYERERFPNDFYPGLIVFLDRVRGRGVIRSQSGREIRFEFPFVSVVGADLGGRAPGIDLVHQGDRVGFDVGWTSKGLRVTRIRPTSKDSSE